MKRSAWCPRRWIPESTASTPPIYSSGESERIVGKAIAGGLRDRVVLATKFHFPVSADPNDRGNSRRHIMQAVEASLKRLGTDWIDLYQAHRPDFGSRTEAQLDEALPALERGLDAEMAAAIDALVPPPAAPSQTSTIPPDG